MTGPSDFSRYDQAARQLIRNKLLHYERTHLIGAPELGERIHETLKLPKKIPLSTLQRFLVGRTRTTEPYVYIFEQFTEGMPCPDPIGALGKAMAEFYASQEADRYAGNFALTVSYKMSGKRGRLNSGLEITADEGFCRVAEWSDQRRFLSCEGVLVCDGQTAIVTLHDKLTYRAKQFLMIADGKKISGRGTLVDFEPSVAGERQPSLLFISLSMIEQPIVPVLRPSIAPAIDSSMRYSNMIARRRLLNLPELGPEEDLLFQPFPILGQHPRDKAKSGPKPLDEKAKQVPHEQSAFLTAAKGDDLATVQRLLESGAEIDTPDLGTGLTALHLAVARNALDVRFLVSQGASFVPDRFGRMPTTIAAECQVSEVMCDFIVEAEAAAVVRAETV